VVVSEKLRDSVVEVNRVSDRLMSIKIDSGTKALRIVSYYAPQTNCTIDEKDEFWESLETRLQSFNSDEHLVIGGDHNDHVRTTRDGYTQCHGGNGIGTHKEDRCRILDCAEAHDLAVANNFFKKKQAHLIAYNSGGHTTQIDFWLLQRRDLKLTTNVKVIPSNKIAPQHYLLVMDMQLELEHKRRARTTVTEKVK
jgi:hypothetical protein